MLAPQCQHGLLRALELEWVCRLGLFVQEGIEELVVQVQGVRAFLDDDDAEALEQLEDELALEQLESWLFLPGKVREVEGDDRHCDLSLLLELGPRLV